MAHIHTIPSSAKIEEDLQKELIKWFQSGNINFLIGSGASVPAIPLAGTVEQEVTQLFKENKENEAYKKLYNLLLGLQPPNNILINESNPTDTNISQVLENYRKFIEVLERILVERKSTILAKRANLFTTNYDLFVERAAESFQAVKLNDGFNRTTNLKSVFTFDPRTFSNNLLNTGNLYTYTVEVPSINLIKIHGSLSWAKQDDNNVRFQVACKELSPIQEEDLSEEQRADIDSYALILPQKDKFRETLLNRFYYDLLRIYANELDKENTLLVAFGFSFADEHIYDITKRALKNPTLQLLIFAHSVERVAGFQSLFEGYRNVKIFSPTEGNNIGFGEFNSILESIISGQTVKKNEA